MKEAVTIYYASQGYIYRCPECNRADRMPWSSPPKEAQCRFCEKSFKPAPVVNMNAELYSVIQEINTMETGTPFGASQEMLESDNLVKAGKSVGIDVLGAINKATPKKEDSYFAPWRIDKRQLAKLMETDEGKTIFAEVKKIMMNPDGFEKNPDAKLVKELWEEGRLMVLMKKYEGQKLTKQQKIDILQKAGYREVHQEEKGKKRVYVFFGSTYAPECDSWVYWD